MKKILLALSLLFAFGSNAQTINFAQMCVLNMQIDTANNELDVTIFNGDSNAVNYPTVVVTNAIGDTVGNINNTFYLFAHLAGDTVTHSIPTTLDSLPAGFICTIYFTDQIWDTTYAFSYPMNCTVGINENYASNSILIYPNPATDDINISIKKQNTSVAFISIIDISGKEVRSYSTPNNQLSINREGLENGMYFLSILVDEKRYTSKLIVK